MRARWARSDGRGRGEEVCAGGLGVYTGPQKADAGAVHPAPNPDRGALRRTAALAPRGVNLEKQATTLNVQMF